MLSVADALTNVQKATHTLPTEMVGLLEAFDRVLAEDILSAEDLPPFDNSSMDGFAVRAEDTADVPVVLRIVSDILAGSAPDYSLQTGEAARIMTGAPIPPGADAVVPIENTDATWDTSSVGHTVTIRKSASSGANIRRRGENITRGSVVIRRGAVLSPADIGMLASLGYAQVPVIRQPRVAIVTSGDEIVRFDATPAVGQIRDGNTPALAAMVKRCGGLPSLIPPARDTLEDMHRMIDDALATQPDLILSTAGVSVGAADFTRQALEQRGQLEFWKINIRPGKPLAFGNIDGIPFYGLPGNPVSALVTFEILVQPALLKMAGRPYRPTVIEALTAHDFTSDGRESYLRVRLHRAGEQWYATETGTQSSGALMSLVQADGLLIVPAGVTFVPRDTLMKVRLLRTPREQEDA
ncbi:gephyrin-like molybdotransferase Glp [Aggregatilineales bacterium SYSU G02658]